MSDDDEMTDADIEIARALIERVKGFDPPMMVMPLSFVKLYNADLYDALIDSYPWLAHVTDYPIQICDGEATPVAMDEDES